LFLIDLLAFYNPVISILFQSGYKENSLEDREQLKALEPAYFRTHWQRAAGRKGNGVLSTTARVSHVGLTQTNESPVFPGWFNHRSGAFQCFWQMTGPKWHLCGSYTQADLINDQQ